MIKSLILSLILTIILEILVSYILGIRSKHDFKVVILVNIYTNPIVVFLSNIVQLMNNALIYYCSVFILEIGAVVIETLLYKKYLKYADLVLCSSHYFFIWYRYNFIIYI